MVPGFVQLGVLAVSLQAATIAGLYASLRRRSDSSGDSLRPELALGVGLTLAVVGQLAAIGAIGSLRTDPLLDLQGTILVQNVGFGAAIVGYVGVGIGVLLYSRR